MRAVIQRVKEASVTIEGAVYSQIGLGFLILLGIEEADTQEDIKWLSGKISKLRVFGDDQGAMNRSVTDVGGECQVVSQFTLHASTHPRSGPRRPSAGIPGTAADASTGPRPPPDAVRPTSLRIPDGSIPLLASPARRGGAPVGDPPGPRWSRATSRRSTRHPRRRQPRTHRRGHGRTCRIQDAPKPQPSLSTCLRWPRA